MKIQENYIIAVLALFCCLLWGSAFPCIKIGYEWFRIENAASQIYFAGWRFCLAGFLVLILFYVRNHRLPSIQRASVPAVIAQGFLQTTVQYFFFYLGLAHTTGAKGALIVGSNVFFSILIAKIIFHEEKLGFKKTAGCLIGFAGVILINLIPGTLESGFTWNGEGFVLLSAIAYGASNVTTKLITKKETTEAVTAYQLITGGLILILSGYASGGTMAEFTLKSALLFFYMVALSATAFTIWATLLKHNSVSKVTPYGFSNRVFGTFLSGLFLGERILTWNNFVALIMVSIGIIMVNTEKHK